MKKPFDIYTMKTFYNGWKEKDSDTSDHYWLYCLEQDEEAKHPRIINLK